jgi:hypothetical protein
MECSPDPVCTEAEEERGTHGMGSLKTQNRLEPTILHARLSFKGKD